MAYYGPIPLDEIVHFDVTTHVFSTGAVSDADSTPSYEVFEEDTDTAIVSGNFTKRTSKTGDYRGSFTASAANGFEVGKFYSVIASATVSSVSAKDNVLTFRIVPAESSAGVPKTDPSHLNGSAIQAASGYIKVSEGTGTGQLDLTSGRPGIDWAKVANPTTTVGLSGTTVKTATDVETDTADIQSRLPAALVSGRMDSSVGAMAANTLTASALASDAVTEIRSLVSGTSDSGTTTTMVDVDRSEADTDYWKGQWILFTSGNISGQCRLITAFDAATDTITFTPATTQAVATQTYEILPAGAIDLRLWNGSAPSNLISGRVDANAQAAAADLITSTVLAASAVTEIQSAILSDATPFAGANVDATISSRASQTSVNTIDDFVDTEVAAILAAVDTEVAAIKTKTDQLTFTTANQVDAQLLSAAANTITASALATDAVTEIWAKTMTELSAVPGVTGTMLEAISWIFTLARNKIEQTATTQTLRKDDTTTALATASVSDDGVTAIRGEWV